MNLESLTHSNGEWLRGNGPECDIVISSRIRLARNLSSFPFTNRASAHQKAEIEVLLREAQKIPEMMAVQLERGDLGTDEKLQTYMREVLERNFRFTSGFSNAPFSKVST